MIGSLKVLELKARGARVPEVIQLPPRATIHHLVRQAAVEAQITTITAAATMIVVRGTRTTTAGVAIGVTTTMVAGMTIRRHDARTRIRRLVMIAITLVGAARGKSRAAAIGAIGRLRRKTAK